MGNKKKDLESLKRLRELEKQLREYTEEDYLREAEKMEREMAKQQVDFELPEGFIEQVLAKGKLMEAEQRKQERIASGQKTQKKNAARRVESGSAQAAALMKLSDGQGQEETGLQKKADLQKKEEACLQETVVYSEGMASSSGDVAEEEKRHEVAQQEIRQQEIKKQEITQQEIARREMTQQGTTQESGTENVDTEQESGLRAGTEARVGEQRIKEQVRKTAVANAGDVRQKLKPLTFQAEEEHGERVEIGEADQVSLRTAKLKEMASEQSPGAETSNAGSLENAAIEKEKAKPRSGVRRSVGQASGQKTGRRKLRWRVLLVLGVLVAFMVFGVSSGGKKHFSFELRPRDESGNNVAFSNGEYIDGEAGEVEGYKKIENEIGIDALMVGDRPYDMIFKDIKIEGQSANLLFVYKDIHYFTIIESVASSLALGEYAVDGQPVEDIYNEILDMYIPVSEEKFVDGGRKYCAAFSVDNAYYIISGYMDLENFRFIIKDLHF